jgi:hypothetical protein
MSHDPQAWTALQQARAGWNAQRAATVQSIQDIAVAEQALQIAAAGAPAQDLQVVAAQQSYDAALTALDTARSAERAARATVTNSLAAWMDADLGADVRTLSDGYPIALMPVRLEARFYPPLAPSVLRVRIYPDAIQSDTHAPELTPDEGRAGDTFWSSVAGGLDEAEAWRRLLLTSDAPRGTYIVHATNPANPRPASRPSSWARAAETRLLPDRWIIVAYRGSREVARAVTKPVVEPLALTFSPLAGATGDASQLGSDPDVGWTVDFQNALNAGMAVELPLSTYDAQAGFDRVIATGVKASLDPASTALQLNQLLQDHAWSSGIAFVPQGSPTNNTGDGPSYYPPDDPNGSASYALQFQSAAPAAGSDGKLFADALGLDASVVTTMAAAAGGEQAAAHDMNTLLWSATLGYTLRELMAPGFDAITGSAGAGLFSGSAISAARTHFQTYVRGRGPVPAFRIGSTPYGLLPATSLIHWTGFGSSPVHAYDLVLVGCEPATGTASSFDQVRIGRGVHSIGNTLNTARDMGTPLRLTSFQCAFATGGWQGGGRPDLYVVYAMATASGNVEYAVLSAASDYAWVAERGVTPLASNGNYAFAVGKWDVDNLPDLFVINRQGSTSTEVTVLSGASQFQTVVFQGATALPKTDAGWRFALGDWNKDGVGDLFAVQITGAASNHIEVHILSGASHFQSEILHVDTGLAAAANLDVSIADWNGDGTLDVILVGRNQPGATNMTVTVLRGDQNLQPQTPSLTASLPEVDPMPGMLVLDISPDYGMAADWDGDGRAELIVVRNEGSTGSGFMAVKVLSPWPVMSYPDAASLPDPNRGSRTTIASTTAHFATDGSTDLVLMQASVQAASTDLFYRIARGLDGCGIPSRFSPDDALPAGPSPAASVLGAGVATADLDGDGFQELVFFHVDSNAGTTRGSYRVGWKLDANGVVDHWTADVAVPYPGRVLRPPIHLGGSMTLADLDGNGRPDMVVLLAERTLLVLSSPSLYYVVGKNLDATGQVTGGWGNAVSVPYTLRAGSALAVAGIAVAEIAGNGLFDVVVAYQDVAVADRTTWYRIGWNLDQNGVPQGGWSDPFRFPQADLAAGAGISLTKLSRGGWTGMLRQLVERFGRGAFGVPRVGMSADAEADLLKAMTLHASSRKVALRAVLGSETLVNLFAYAGAATFLAPLNTNWTNWYQRTQRRARELFESLGEPAWNTARENVAWMPRVADTVMEPTPGLFEKPIVAPEPLSETQELQPLNNKPNYLRWLADLPPVHLTAADIALDNATHAVDAAWPLLFYLARHALLVEYTYAAFAIDVVQGKSTAAQEQDPELVGIIPGTPVRTPWQRLLDTMKAGSSGPTPVWEFLYKNGPGYSILLVELREALKRLASRPTADLDRLASESLDVCSHRVDSWVTSVATRRLQSEMRTAEASGVYVGGYGWLERVVPVAKSLYTSQTGNQTVLVPRAGGGYIHAPSASMASAAAVLRNAFMTRGGQTTAYAIDLSSQRARTAREVLDSVRQGVPLAAALGYRVERILDEAGLRKYIELLRARYTLTPLQTPAKTAGAPTAGRMVLDGLALRADWGQADIPAQLTSIQADQEQLHSLLDGELGAASASSGSWMDPLDAVADTLMAESVYQTVRGNKTAAAAALDAMSQGTRPPEPEILRQPRSGVAVTHRVALVFGAPGTTASNWPAMTPRAAADPQLDAWAGSLLGDPSRVRCRASATTGAGTAATDLGVITLAELNLRPLDVLQLARTPGTPGGASELDRRIAWVALSKMTDPGSAQIAIAYDRDSSWPAAAVSFADLLELARAINAMMGRARPLKPTDLLAPDTETPTIQTAPSLDDAKARAHAAAQALGDATAALDAAMSANPVVPATLASALLSLSMLNMGSGVPVSVKLDDLMAQAGSAIDLAHKRQSNVASLIGVMDAGGGWDAAEDARSAVQAIFGQDLPFLVAFTPAEAHIGELAQALGAEGDLLSGGTISADEQVRRWMMGSARVRPTLDLWRRVALYANALGGLAQSWNIAQLPFTPGDHWVALPPASNSQRAGVVSLVLGYSVKPTTASACAGLLVDEWSETIPSPTAPTAVSFHYPSPHAQAPQSVLLAVPPSLGGQWNLDALLAILNETVDLAHVRATDVSLAGSVGQFLPAALLACNLSGDTVSTDFRYLRTAE